jgi:hypothetical protein
MVRAAIFALCWILALLAASSAPVWAHDEGSDQAAIRQLMRNTWERADAPLSVEPIVVVGDFAIAAWIQDDRGGRALLRRHHKIWEVTLCSGDHLRSAETARAAGVPGAVAEQLVAQLLETEKHMAPERLAKLSLFDGIVRMDGTSPAPHHKH